MFAAAAARTKPPAVAVTGIEHAVQPVAAFVAAVLLVKPVDHHTATLERVTLPTVNVATISQTAPLPVGTLAVTIAATWFPPFCETLVVPAMPHMVALVKFCDAAAPMMAA